MADLQAGSAGFSACFISGSGPRRLKDGQKEAGIKKGRLLSVKRSLPCFKTELPDQFFLFWPDQTLN
jgi:hypothetical protein